ncbi:MFS general substrate transporter [Hesseltinella vesiculosa]|uniref:MFS general substrate transporter n=1 Tax=Hesseltinella vesiculosa TaxID=101127 RepID=A0A1X2GRG8_9FUNG|nr:MFS general substrate transporter [Hesseltinella vesiculosa]
MDSTLPVMVNEDDPIKANEPTVMGHDQQSNAILEKRLVRKLDIRLIPWVAVLYLLLSLDRNNIGNARLGSLEKDLNLEGNDYYTALTIFFAGYVIFMIPSNLMVKRLKPSRFIATTMILWGICSFCQAFTHNAAGLIACRFFLGAAETGVGPATPLYLSYWYKSNELATRVGIYFGSSTIAGAFAGALGYAILKTMDGAHGIAGWRWIFMIEAIPTMVLGLLSYIVLPNMPTSNNRPWLTLEERQLAIDRLSADGNTDAKSFDKTQFVASFLDFRVWLSVLIYVGLNVALASFAVFLPSIISGLGFSSLNANLLTIPPYVAACILLFFISWNADRTMQRGYHILAVSSIGVLGYIFLLASESVGLRYAGAVLVACGIYPNIPLMQAWVANNNVSHTKRATSLAVMSMVAQCFAILGTQIYKTTDAPRYMRGHAVCLGFMVLAFVSTATLRYCLARENQRRDRQHGLPSGKDLAALENFSVLYERHPEFRYAL